MRWLLVLVTMVCVGNDAVYVEYQDTEEIDNDDADFDDQYESEDVVTTPPTSLTNAAHSRIRRYEDRSSGARTLSLDEIRDVKGAIKELLAGHQLDHLTTYSTETTIDDVPLTNELITKDPSFTGLTMKIDLADPTKLYEDIIEEIIDNAKRQGLLTTSILRQTETNAKFETSNNTEDEQITVFPKTEALWDLTRHSFPRKPGRTSNNLLTPENSLIWPQRTQGLPGRTQILPYEKDYLSNTTRKFPNIFHDFEGLPQGIPEWIKNFPQMSPIVLERTSGLPERLEPTFSMGTLITADDSNKAFMKNKGANGKKTYVESSKSGVREGEDDDTTPANKEEEEEAQEIKKEEDKGEGEGIKEGEKDDGKEEGKSEESDEQEGGKKEGGNEGVEKEEKEGNLQGEKGEEEKEENKEGETGKEIEEEEDKNKEGEKKIKDKKEEGDEGEETGGEKEKKKDGEKGKKKEKNKDDKEKQKEKSEESDDDSSSDEEQNFKPMTMPTTTTTTTTTKSRKIADPHYYPYPYTSQLFPNTTKTIFTTSIWRTRRRKTTTTTTVPTTTLGPQFDVPGLLQIISNLTYDFESNITELFNKTLQKYNIPTCPSIEVTEQPIYYDLTNATVVSKCFVCGMHEAQIPFDSFCNDAFAGDFLPVVPIDPQARRNIARYRKYCRYLDVDNFYENETEPRSVYGRFTGGCSVRWIDLSGIYTQRACRNRRYAMTGAHFASKRMAKLELALHELDNGCIISPMASLVPLSRGISLYARFHACVCTGSWCNNTSVNQAWIVYIAVLALWVITSLLK